MCAVYITDDQQNATHPSRERNVLQQIIFVVPHQRKHEMTLFIKIAFDKYIAAKEDFFNQIRFY